MILVQQKLFKNYSDILQILKDVLSCQQDSQETGFQTNFVTVDLIAGSVILGPALLAL